MSKGMFGVRLVGADAMVATLREAAPVLSIAVTRNAVRRAMVREAQPIADEMRGLAPRAVVATSNRQLPDAVGVFTRLSSRQRAEIGKSTYNVRSGNTAANRNSAVVVYVGVESGMATLIGVWQEFGTDVRHQESGKSVGQITPHPFVRPAFESGAQPFLNRIGAPVGAEIEKAVDRARRKNAKRGGK